MKLANAEMNLLAAWTGILAGFVSGMVLGLFFHREDWLGGYGSLKRRMYRLGHISLFGLGAVNLFFWLTTNELSSTNPLVGIASWTFVVGAISMPLCCVLMAHVPKARLLFAIPVLSLIVGGVATIALVVQNADRPAINHQLSTINSS
jgi:hypothetical protein